MTSRAAPRLAASRLPALLALPTYVCWVRGGYAGQEAEQAWRRQGSCYSRHAACACGGLCGYGHANDYLTRMKDVSAPLLDCAAWTTKVGQKLGFSMAVGVGRSSDVVSHVVVGVAGKLPLAIGWVRNGSE